MKKFLLITSLLMFASTGAWAFGSKHESGDGDGRHLAKMTQKLNLTSEQQDKIKALMVDSKPEKKSDRKSFKKELMQLNPDDSDYNSQLEALADKKALQVKEGIIKRGQMRAEIYKILTPEQKVKAKEMREENKGKDRKHGKKKDR